MQETNRISLQTHQSTLSYSASVSLAWPIVLNMCYESSRVAQLLCLSESRPARIMSLLRYCYYPKTTWNTFWNSAWPWMIQLQSYITLSSRINKVERHKMVFFVFFRDWPSYDLDMTSAWPLRSTPVKCNPNPSHHTLQLQIWEFTMNDIL